jgi:hypothetical protein
MKYIDCVIKGTVFITEIFRNPRNFGLVSDWLMFFLTPH